MDKLHVTLTLHVCRPRNVWAYNSEFWRLNHL